MNILLTQQHGKDVEEFDLDGLTTSQQPHPAFETMITDVRPMTQRRDNNSACCWQIKDENVLVFWWNAKTFSEIETAPIPLPNKRIQKSIDRWRDVTSFIFVSNDIHCFKSQQLQLYIYCEMENRIFIRKLPPSVMTSISPLEETKLTRRLALGVMSIGFGQSAFIVLVPLVMARLGLTTLDLGLAVAAGTLAFLIGAPLWGNAGGRIGYGRMIRLLGLAMLGAQVLLVIQLSAGPTAYAVAMAGLILSRLIYGFAAAGVMPAAQAWLAGTVEPGRRQAAFGLLSAGLNFGRLAGSVAGAAAAIAAPLTVALFMLAPLMLWLTPKGTAKAEALAKVPRLSPFDKRILPFLLIGVCMTAGFGQVQIMLGPLLQSKLGLDAAQATAATGAALALVAVAMIAVQTLVLPRLRWSERSGILAGIGLVVAGMAGLAIANNYSVGALALAATGFGTALATPAYTAWLARRVETHEQGAAAGWLSSAHIVGQTAGALMGGFAFQLAAELPLIGCAGLAVAAAAIAATLQRRG